MSADFPQQNSYYPASPQTYRPVYYNDSDSRYGRVGKSNVDQSIYNKQYEDKLNRNQRADNYKSSKPANYFGVYENAGGYTDRTSPQKLKNTSYGSYYQNPETMKPFYERYAQKEPTQGGSNSVNTSKNYMNSIPDLTAKMRNPMYSDFDYTHYEGTNSSRRPLNKNSNHDSIDNLKSHMDSKLQSSPYSRRGAYPELTDVGSYDAVKSYSSPKLEDKKVSFGTGVAEEKSSPKKYMDTGIHTKELNYYTDLATVREPVAPKSQYSSVGDRSLERKPNEIYVFNPLTQSPMMRYQKNNRAF